jgi:UDP-D-galactose:(glucosyl)LPS alpha-1,3-D-galactosyltransferase
MGAPESAATAAPAAEPGAGGPDALPPVVCVVNDRYSGPVCVLLQSIADAHGPASDLRVIVLHRSRSLSGWARERILFHADRVGLRVELRRVADPPAHLPLFGRLTEDAYLRLMMPVVLADIPLALYLDADLLVLDDLRPLMATSLHGAPLAAVRDAVNPVLAAGRALPGFSRLGLAASREYFNSGVMMLDLAACRGVFDDAHRFMRERPEHVALGDQDALNVAVADGWRRLERRWNTFAMAAWTGLEDWSYRCEAVLPLATLVEDERSAAILHYPGPLKPWQATYPVSAGKQRYRSVAARIEEGESGADL